MMHRRCWLVSCGLAMLLAVSASLDAIAGDAATWRFSTGEGGTCPKTVTITKTKITVDISALPKEAKVFRAVLGMSRGEFRSYLKTNQRVLVVSESDPSKPLVLRAPRYRSLEATDVVKQALAGGKKTVAFQVKSLPAWKPESSRLDVSFTGAKARNEIPTVKSITSRHNNGQTILTWNEVDPPITQEKVGMKEWDKLRKIRRPHTYRIYRSLKPFSAETIATAELVDEVGHNTCWNAEFYGLYKRGPDVKRYVVDGGKAPVPPGTGIYAHNPSAAGKAYYAVMVALSGEENLSAFTEANCLSQAMDEKVGPGDPVLQRKEVPDKFHYVAKPTLRFYVRWESPPRCNLPSRPYDYMVGELPGLRDPAPLVVSLHCWGANVIRDLPWRGHSKGSLLLTTNQIPYDWWMSYHEAMHTWKCWKDGKNRDYTVRRVFGMMDWVQSKWNVRKNTIMLRGASMGGSGTSMIVTRYPERFAHAGSEVGVHIAAKTPKFKPSYERSVGSMAANLPHESGKKVFDYLDNTKILRETPNIDRPLLRFSNGKNDSNIGWPQAVEFVKALQETRQPHVFSWGMRGHGQAGVVPLGNGRFTATPGGGPCATDKTVLAFAKCSLDHDIDSVNEGGINAFQKWTYTDLVDEGDRYEITVYLHEKAPRDECTTDITPRRLQKFKTKAGEKVKWRNTLLSGGTEVQSGEATADKWGLMTLTGVKLTKEKHRIAIELVK